MLKPPKTPFISEWVFSGITWSYELVNWAWIHVLAAIPNPTPDGLTQSRTPKSNQPERPYHWSISSMLRHVAAERKGSEWWIPNEFKVTVWAAVDTNVGLVWIEIIQTNRNICSELYLSVETLHLMTCMPASPPAFTHRGWLNGWSKGGRSTPHPPLTAKLSGPDNPTMQRFPGMPRPVCSASGFFLMTKCTENNPTDFSPQSTGIVRGAYAVPVPSVSDG